MKASDYIVEELIRYGIEDVFGYPGGTVTHLMDSLNRNSDRVKPHLLYHEQAVAFAACSYAESGRSAFGVAFATSGPGATNLITGICNAYFDSIPVLFITGQVNSDDVREDIDVRQVGFQQTDIISMVRGCTKYARYVKSVDELPKSLDTAIHYMINGRPGPVLLDIPMNVFRMDVSDSVKTYKKKNEEICESDIENAYNIIQNSERPVIVLGHGVHLSHAVENVRVFTKKNGIPVVSSLLGVDIISRRNLQYYGFIGAYGDRSANFIVAKADLLICLGTRLDIRQTGKDRIKFAENARILRVDIDNRELSYKVHDDDIGIYGDIQQIVKRLNKYDYIEKTEWNYICNEIRRQLRNYEPHFVYNNIVSEMGNYIVDDAWITTDVGQNQIWVAQSLSLCDSQRMLFSGGHGAMGYSIPAAIGCAYARRKPVIAFCGDGGFQMNIQELQTIARDQLPITIIVFNNKALGMIRHFQEMYFDSAFTLTVDGRGYTSPNFQKIADTYGFKYYIVRDSDDIEKCELSQMNRPKLIEVYIPDATYISPKLEYGKPNQDQEPLIDRKLYRYLMEL